MSGAADFTPNPARAIWVEGKLNDALLARLRPQILALTQSREPITVFINSRGGSNEAGLAIMGLLKRTDDARASRIITVAAPKAQSAAANLLSAGDFAIASPQSDLLYHGGRWPMHERELTSEWARLAVTLPAWHEVRATALARSSVRRFLSIVSSQRALFAQHRAEKGEPNLTDVDCFQDVLRGKLSPAARKVLELAIHLRDTHDDLLVHFHKRLRRGRAVTKDHLRKLMLHASIAFEHETNASISAFDAGLSGITEHFHFLNSYFDLGQLCDWVAAREEPQAPGTDVEDLQFRLFFGALCRALQEGENHLTPMDAVWLGLVDTLRDEISQAVSVSPRPAEEQIVVSAESCSARTRELF